MPRPSIEREAVEVKIDRVRSLGVDSLRTLWHTTFRSSPPPAFRKDILARFLCWHIQAGWIPRPQSISMDSHGATGLEPITPPAPQAGTVLLREYQGERHTVTVGRIGHD
jgi:hypothetical protein